jgi:hypothetical protein
MILSQAFQTFHGIFEVLLAARQHRDPCTRAGEFDSAGLSNTFGSSANKCVLPRH